MTAAEVVLTHGTQHADLARGMLQATLIQVALTRGTLRVGLIHLTLRASLIQAVLTRGTLQMWTAHLVPPVRKVPGSLELGLLPLQRLEAGWPCMGGILARWRRVTCWTRQPSPQHQHRFVWTRGKRGLWWVQRLPAAAGS